jgi:hypothetical protein
MDTTYSLMQALLTEYRWMSGSGSLQFVSEQFLHVEHAPSMAYAGRAAG